MTELTPAPTAHSMTGKVALVTGGTTGIGRATAERLRNAGARVVVTGVSPDSVDRARRELGDGILVLRSDTASLAEIASLAATVNERFGGLDVLFLNAGIAAVGPFESVDEATFDAHFEVNVKGVFFTLQAMLPLLRDGSSVLVNTSVASLKASPGMAVYAASKGALSSLVRTLAVELRGRGIRVNAISPATIHTAIQAKFGLPAEMQSALEQEFAGRIPLGRFGEVDEVAQLALFLASPLASYIHGAEIAVDGGLLVA